MRKLVDELKVARLAEKADNKEIRNLLAENIFKKWKSYNEGDTIVETYFDRTSRSYITWTYVPSDKGNDIYEYSGNKGDAAVQHFWSLCKALNIN